MSGLKRLLAHRRYLVALLAVLLVLSFVLLALVLAQSTPDDLAAFSGHDFTQYYSAARLLVQRANPYDPVALLAQERSIGWLAADPILMWNPPWTIALVLPLIVLPFGLAAWVWLVLNLGLMLVCGAVLWRVIAPDDRRYWLGIILAFIYLPTFQALRIGQISPWLLAGITGFLVAVRCKRDALAGASLVLLTIKPHISFIFLFAVACWIVRERRWRVLIGGAVTLAAACAVVGLISPAVFAQYLRVAAGPPLYWRSATLGTWLRSGFGAEQHWLQFSPSVIGLLLFVVWALRHKGEWNWPRLAPGLLLASTIFAAYGWPFDQVVLLPLVVVLFARLHFLSRRQRVVLISLYVLTQLGMLLLNQYGIDASYYYWYPLVLAGLYAWQQRMITVIPPKVANEVTECG